jgi:hypothetical protein
VLWLGTWGGGLNRLDFASGKFSAYTDFPSSVIYGIQEDASGRLWLSTNHGLSRFDPASGRIDNYDYTNGLQSLQFHLGASFKTRAGRMLFGGVGGFYTFDPEAITPQTFAPPVVFTALRLFDDPLKPPVALSTAERVTLWHRDKAFSVEFAALDLAIPRRNQYEYRMEGFDDHWIRLGPRRELTFTNLEPGTYRLHVKASNSDGVWSDASTAALEIVIRPNWWETWLFRGSIAALIGLAIVAYRRRARRGH